MATLFISDLHLWAERETPTRLFFDFLAGPARDAEALYILGDLFEAWAGDDDLSDVFNARICSSLRTLSKEAPIYFMAGNRDFLSGDRFASAAGVRVLAEPTSIVLHGIPTLLVHGDTLCTDDIEYQSFRAQVRSPEWRDTFLAMPLPQRKARIADLRRLSERETRKKPAAIMDVNVEAVAELLRSQGYPRLIHGHTHRPGHHWHEVDGRRCERWVLPDWYQRGGYLACAADRCGLVTL